MDMAAALSLDQILLALCLVRWYQHRPCT